jgi:hypothetical protein
METGECFLEWVVDRYSQGQGIEGAVQVINWILSTRGLDPQLYKRINPKRSNKTKPEEEASKKKMNRDQPFIKPLKKFTSKNDYLNNIIITGEGSTLKPYE